METRPNNLFIYQILVNPDRSPADVVHELTYAVWDALKNEIHDLDPHRWPNLYVDFQNIFKKKLVLYQKCGKMPQCEMGLHPVLGVEKKLNLSGNSGSNSRVRLFTLEIKRDLNHFIQGMCAVANRHFRDIFHPNQEENKRLNARIELAIRRALSTYLFHNEFCSHCMAREENAEHRIWKH